MKVLLSIPAILVATVSLLAFAQSDGSALNGKAVYDQWCVHCHGGDTHTSLPGTRALQIRYNGTLPAILTERTDLAPEYIRTVVRGGLVSMPASRKTEISDSDLDDIVVYLTGAAGD